MRTNTGKNIKLKTGKSNLDIVNSYLNGERAFLQVGYDANLENSTRKDGEEWEDSQGNKWKKENGIKKKIPKVAKIKIEEKCSICNLNINFGNYLDQRVYNRCGRCYDCSIIFDSRLKVLGKFNEYARYTVYSTQYSKLKDFKNKILESIEYLEKCDPKLKYYNSDGTHEVWTDDTDARVKVLEDLKKDLVSVEKQILESEEELKKVACDFSIEDKAKEMTLEFIKNKEARKFDV